MEEDRDGPDVVSIERRDPEQAAAETGAARATATTTTMKDDAARRAALAGVTPSSFPLLPSSSGAELQHQAQASSPLPLLLTKNQRHKLRQKRCRLARRLTMQVRKKREEEMSRGASRKKNLVKLRMPLLAPL
jgi:hypothetical protein